MHVGLNLIYLVPGQTGGTETYAKELIRALREQAPEIALTAFINREAGAGPPLLPPDVNVVRLPVSGRNRLDWVRGEQLLLPRAAEYARVDLVHSLANTAPSWGKFRRIVTIHDLHYRVAPESHFGLRGYGMRVLVPLAARTSHRVIAISETTATDIREHLGPRSPVDVIPQGVRAITSPPKISEAEVRRRFDLSDRAVLLTFSAKRRHKNLLRLLEAVALLPENTRPILVLPGYATPHESELKAAADRHRITKDIRFLNWVRSDEQETLYATATLFVFPSLYEGFALPILEAMAHGVPVCCSNRGAMQEVAGNAAETFDPEDARAIADALSALLANRDKRERLRAKGLERAAAFSWERTAARTRDSYRAAMANEGSARDSRVRGMESGLR